MTRPEDPRRPRDARGSEDPRRLLGARGEELAARHLEARGLEVVERNFRTRYGELDVVARDERCLVFCEVKTRVLDARDHGERNPLGPFAAIGARKQRQVRAMAREWLANDRAAGSRPPELRFDAIGISFDRAGRLLSLEHLEAAF